MSWPMLSGSEPRVVGVILAGGGATRMGGGDKTLLPLGQSRILDWVIMRLAPQVEASVVSANGDPARFAAAGLPVVPDSVVAPAGPLAGIRAALDWAARQQPDFGWVLTVPGDTPFIPDDLRRRLQREAGSGPACAASGGRVHWAVALWPMRLRAALGLPGTSSVGAFARSHGCRCVSWPDAPVDPFYNINTPADLAVAESLAARAATRPACRRPG